MMLHKKSLLYKSLTLLYFTSQFYSFNSHVGCLKLERSLQNTNFYYIKNRTGNGLNTNLFEFEKWNEPTHLDVGKESL